MCFQDLKNVHHPSFYILRFKFSGTFLGKKKVLRFVEYKFFGNANRSTQMGILCFSRRKKTSRKMFERKKTFNSPSTMRSKKDLQFARCTFFGDAGRYGVAPISKLPKIIRLFCKRALQKRLFSAKDTHNFKEPSNRSHPISPTRLIFSKSQLTTTSATQVHMGWL